MSRSDRSSPRRFPWRARGAFEGPDAPVALRQPNGMYLPQGRGESAPLGGVGGVRYTAAPPIAAQRHPCWKHNLPDHASRLAGGPADRAGATLDRPGAPAPHALPPEGGLPGSCPGERPFHPPNEWARRFPIQFLSGRSRCLCRVKKKTFYHRKKPSRNGRCRAVDKTRSCTTN